MKTSSFAGFLDGYQSRNIAAVENNLNTRLNDTISLIYELINYHSLNDEELKFFLTKSLQTLNEKNYYNVISVLYEFGELLKLNTPLINKVTGHVDAIAKEKIRKVIYNYANLAKLSEDPILINLAIDIGEKFSF